MKRFTDMANPTVTPDMEFVYLDEHLHSAGTVAFSVEMPSCCPEKNQVAFQYENGEYRLWFKERFRTAAHDQKLLELGSGRKVCFASMDALRQYIRSIRFSDTSDNTVSEAASAPAVRRRPMPKTERNALNMKRVRQMQALDPDTLFADITEIVRGQGEAVRSVVRYACAAAAKIHPKRPLSLVLAGNTGEGKTLVGKTLAESLNRQITDPTKQYGTIVVQCNELTENHDVSRLVGGSPNYVGYGDDTMLTPVFTNPYQVIVFDEIEKAAPRVLDILMAAMDCGEIMMTKPVDGKTMIDLKHCILLFTTNLRIAESAGGSKKPKIGFGTEQAELPPAADLSIRYRDALVAQGIRREIAARFTDIICFRELNDDAVVDIILQELQNCAEEFGFGIRYVCPEILQALYDEVQLSGFGARMIKRTVSNRFDLFFAADEANGSEQTFELRGTLTAPILTDPE